MVLLMWTPWFFIYLIYSSVSAFSTLSAISPRVGNSFRSVQVVVPSVRPLRIHPVLARQSVTLFSDVDASGGVGSEKETGIVVTQEGSIDVPHSKEEEEEEHKEKEPFDLMNMVGNHLQKTLGLETSNATKDGTNDTPLEVEPNDKKPFDLKKRVGDFLQLRLSRIVANFWFALTVPFPELRNIARKRGKKHDLVFSLRFRDGFIGFMSYVGVGVIGFHYLFEKFSFVDSLYFSLVCFSTVGYGDLSPVTAAGKVFTISYALTGIALLGAAVATIGSRLVEAEMKAVKIARKVSRKRLFKLYDRMPKVVKQMKLATDKKLHKKIVAEAREEVLEVGKIKEAPGRLAIVLKAARAILQSLAIVAIGGILVGQLEGWNWADSVYYAFITASTIGLGDLSPQTRNGRLCAVFVIPMLVATVGEMLASVGLALIERRQKKIFQTQLHQGLTMSHLNAMDQDGDGNVNREEYVLFMLMEMGLANKSEIEELFYQFDRLDVTNSGYLDQADLALMAKVRVNP